MSDEQQTEMGAVEEVEAAATAMADQQKAKLHVVATCAGYYWKHLRDAEVPESLAEDLVRDWHGEQWGSD